MRIATAFRSLALAAALSMIPAVSHAGVFVSIRFGAPPVLPVYVQPVCPAPGYIWTPGYWAYNEDGGYYWVPGAWVLAPYSGALWTPGYWGYEPTGYSWHPGYWGLHIGFYGGVNYGFGYFGHGYDGGYWNHGRFFYNTAVVRVDHARFHNVVYRKTVIVNRNVTRISYNGGHGGIAARPTADEQRWSHEQHTAPLAAQHQNEMRASQNRQQFANVNHGRPQTAAHTQPVAFNRSMPTNNVNRSVATMPNHIAAPVNNRPALNKNANRPVFNSTQRPTMNSNTGLNRGPQQTYRPPAASANPRPAMSNPSFNRSPQQTYRAQPQHHAAPQQTRQAPQQSRPQEFHGGGHEGGHGGHGR
jgi:hypothetical protein